MKVGSGSARDLLTSKSDLLTSVIFATSLWHAEYPSFITLLPNLQSKDRPANLLSASLHLAEYVDTHIVVVLTIQGHLT